jgi:hypothetical protein
MKQHKSSKRNKQWFVKVRGSYLPNNWAGGLTYIPYLAYIIGVLVYVVGKGYDVWTSMFVLLPNWVAAVAIMNWIAARKS